MLDKVNHAQFQLLGTKGYVIRLCNLAFDLVDRLFRESGFKTDISHILLK